MTITNIDCKTLQNWLQKDEAILIDVREIDEYQRINIAQAKLIPIGTICKDSLPADRGNKKIVIHCHSGKRSLIACEKLLQEDSSLELYNLVGGICAWNDATVK